MVWCGEIIIIVIIGVVGVIIFIIIIMAMHLCSSPFLPTPTQFLLFPLSPAFSKSSSYTGSIY